MEILSYLTPIKIGTYRSEFNGEITVELSCGSYRTVVDKYWQSGDYAKMILKDAFENTDAKFLKVKNVLLLGLGCGTMIEVIKKYIGDFHITGVEIDSQMIQIGKKYFGLENYPSLSIVIKDAFDYLKDLDKRVKYDLIISDIFVGCETDSKTQSEEFVRLLYAHLKEGGIYISNSSYVKKHKKHSEIFLHRIESRFDRVRSIVKHLNLMISAFKER